MDTDKAKLLLPLEKGKGAQEVGDTDKLPGAAFKDNENDMFKKPRKTQSGGGNEMGCSDSDASIIPYKKIKRLGAPPGDNEHADKQGVRNGTVHEESGQNEESGGGQKTPCGYALRGTPVMVAVLAASAALGIGLYRTVTAWNSEESRSSDSGKANQVTQEKENQPSD